MSVLQSYRNLSPTARIGVGVGLLCWGFLGLKLTDRAEDKYGLKPSEDDKAALKDMLLSPIRATVDKGSKGGKDVGPGGDDGKGS